MWYSFHLVGVGFGLDWICFGLAWFGVVGVGVCLLRCWEVASGCAWFVIKVIAVGDSL